MAPALDDTTLITAMDISGPWEDRLAAYAGSRFSAAASSADVPRNFLEALATPKSALRFSIPLLKDDGTLKVLTAWRLRFSDILGPTKGGVRFYPGTNEADLTALAFRLVLKCAANSLPHGGAAGGVDVDPRALSLSEHRRLAQAYVEALDALIGPDADILSPDLGTDARTMGWMAEAYCRRRGVSTAGAINGKPLAMGGIPGRPGATARGALCILEAVLADTGGTLKGMTCSVQGFGSAGGHLAVLLEQRGAKVVAVSDRSCGLHHPDGLNAGELWRHKEQGLGFSELEVAGARRIQPAEVLVVPADLVIPAATANQITKAVAEAMPCRMVLEIANGPVAADAEPVLAARRIEIVPDVIANAGGITMSHFEWAQNRGGLLWSAEDAGRRLEERMRASAEKMILTSRRNKVSLAVAAQLMAIERLRSAVCP